jgi:osmotically inducible protein OsmC
MKRSASAIWKGDIKSGNGAISTETGVLDETSYGFKSRFEDGPGTNPEELIAAAHAGCFSMALSLMLGEADLVPDRIETHAKVSLDKVEGGFEIKTIHLDVKAKVPGIDAETFASIAEKAKQGCPVSKVLAGARISMDAALES